MKNLKGQGGITLVALVVTIIVLLILAGVTILYVMGDTGIFGKAESAASNTSVSTAKELVYMGLLEVQTALADPNDTSVTDVTTAKNVFEDALPAETNATVTFTAAGSATNLACTGTITVGSETYNFEYATATGLELPTE